MVETLLANGSGLLVLALVAAFCLSAAAVTGWDAALLPLPVLAGCTLTLLCAGYLGVVRLGLWCVLSALLAGAVYGGVRAGGRALYRALCSPGFLFFVGASVFFWVLFEALQPMFTQWDEFTFWGAAAKMLKEQNMLYPHAPGNLKARAGLPALSLLSYLYQAFSPRFTEWQCLAAYDSLFMAAIGACAALPRRRWAESVLLLGAGAALPFFFGPVPAGTPGTVYANAMADVPLALLFGGVFCLYRGWIPAGAEEPPRFAARLPGILAVALTAAFLTATKDMGFAYALIAIFVLFLAELAGSPAGQAGKPARRALAAAVLEALPVLAVFGSWSRYAAVTDAAAGGAVGSAGLSYGQVVAGGLRQFAGIGRTEKFSRLMALMGQAFFRQKVCVAGSGAAALVLIAAVAAAAWLLSGRGAARRRVAAVWGGLAFCFAFFYLFHLILYCYNFSDVEALALKDYARYIGPYYAGWMLASLCLLGHAAAAAAPDGLLPARLGGAAVAGVCAAVLVLVGWRGIPVSGFWSNADSLYELRRDVKARAAQANAVLGWGDRVLVLSQGDDATRWYYYNYELTATVVRGFGGLFWGEDSSHRWDSDFMNLVESDNWTLYSYKAVTNLNGLEVYMREKNCGYLLIDRADNYLQEEFSRGFEGGLTPDMPATLYRMVDTGTEIAFVPVAESGVSQ